MKYLILISALTLITVTSNASFASVASEESAPRFLYASPRSNLPGGSLSVAYPEGSLVAARVRDVFEKSPNLRRVPSNIVKGAYEFVGAGLKLRPTYACYNNSCAVRDDSVSEAAFVPGKDYVEVNNTGSSTLFHLRGSGFTKELALALNSSKSFFVERYQNGIVAVKLDNVHGSNSLSCTLSTSDTYICTIQLKN